MGAGVGEVGKWEETNESWQWDVRRDKGEERYVLLFLPARGQAALGAESL
jgi:hypothetical protein